MVNRSLFLISKYGLSNVNLFYRVKVYFIPLLPRRKSLWKYVLFLPWNRIDNWAVFLIWLWRRKITTLIGDDTLTKRELIRYYFDCGYSYKAIVHLLNTYWDISLSERTLKRRLQKCNLRNNSNTDDSVVCTSTRRELQASWQCFRYREMWHLLKKSYSIQMPQDRVMQILREEDPEGAAQGRAHKFLSQD